MAQMIDSNTTQVLINNADKIFPYFLVIIFALVIVLFLFRESIFKKYAKEYFNEEVSKELNNYKKEFFTLLKNQKLANSFKEEPILILNDKEFLIQEVAFMSNYTNQVFATIDEEAKDLSIYRFVILYIPLKNIETNPQDIYNSYVEKFLNKLNREETIVYIYHEGRIDDLKQKTIPKHYVLINSKLTLVERLENTYLIKKIINLT